MSHSVKSITLAPGIIGFTSKSSLYSSELSRITIGMRLLTAALDSCLLCSSIYIAIVQSGVYYTELKDVATISAHTL